MENYLPQFSLTPAIINFGFRRFFSAKNLSVFIGCLGFRRCTLVISLHFRQTKRATKRFPAECALFLAVFTPHARLGQQLRSFSEYLEACLIDSEWSSIEPKQVSSPYIWSTIDC